MMRIRHKEQDTLTGILRYLWSMEKAGDIIHCDRLNSGKVLIPYTLKNGRRKVRLIRLCREGTPDAYFITKQGKVIWIEAKSRKGKQRQEQEKFQAKVENLPGHEYWVIRNADQFETRLASVL